MPTMTNAQFKKHAKNLMVYATIEPFERDKRRIDMSFYGPEPTRYRGVIDENTAQEWRYELTYLPNERDAALAFMRWIIERRIHGTQEPAPPVDIMVPYCPIDPKSLECRYAWTPAAWEKRDR